MIILILLPLALSSDLSNKLSQDLSEKYLKVSGSSAQPFTMFQVIYEQPSPNSASILVLANSSESKVLSLHYFNISFPFKITEHISPIPQGLNVSISKIQELYGIQEFGYYSTLISADLQQIPEFQNRFSLLSALYLSDGNIYRLSAVLDKHQVISSYSWPLTSNKVVILEKSSTFWELFSFFSSFFLAVLLVYAFWFKTKRFPLSHFIETQNPST